MQRMFGCGMFLRFMVVLGMIGLLFGCGSSSSSSHYSSGDTGNSVVAISPEDGETDVAVTKTITVNCEEDVCPGGCQRRDFDRCLG